jgi:hypothetical protein
MGYTTEFFGRFEFNKPLETWLIEYVNKFCETRRMKRDNEKIKELFPNWKDLCFKGDLGVEGEYFIGGLGFMGQDRDGSVVDHNWPAKTQPGLWCQWVVSEDGKYLEWDGNEKFYDYVEWLDYLIVEFFHPIGYMLNGEVNFRGEDYDDFGTIFVTDNIISVEDGIRVASMNDFDDNTLIEELERRGYKVS